MKRSILVLALLFGGVGQAKADILYSFSYSGTVEGNYISGSGTFTTTPLGSGEYLITAVSGTTSDRFPSSGSTVTGTLSLLPTVWSNANGDNLQSDNKLMYPGTPYLDDFNNNAFSGVNLGDSALAAVFPGYGGFNLSSINNGADYQVWNSYGPGIGGIGSGDVSFTVTPAATPVPEPTSLALFGMSTLASAAYYGWRRRKQTKTA